ncbi:MAG: flagellar basal body-associated FliL family protein [Geminicoccaceae bacterium]
MAADSGPVADGGKSKAGRRRALLIITAVAMVILVGAGSAFAYFFGLLGPAPASAAGLKNDEAADGHGSTGEEHVDGMAAAIVFVDMPDIIVNLQSDAPRMRFLKLRVALEVAGETTAEAVRQLLPRVLDGFQLYLRALTVEDARGPTGMQRLKEELTARVNLAVEPARVNDVLLKEMLVQ